jgi:hypothetical protein
MAAAWIPTIEKAYVFSRVLFECKRVKGLSRVILFNTLPPAKLSALIILPPQIFQPFINSQRAKNSLTQLEKRR